MDQTLASTFTDSPAATAVPSETDPRVVTARRVFLGALIFNAAVTLFWLGSYATGSTFFFDDYRITGQALSYIAFYILFF